jgi:hypothetical protein
MQIRWPALVLLLLPVFEACGNTQFSQDNIKTAILKIGEAINFSTGKITRQQKEGDMVFQYQPPQSPHGWRYNPSTGQIEYQAQANITENYPLLAAAKTGSFKTKPDIGKLTAGDINQWTEVEYDIGPGRFLLVRGYTDKKHWLIKILNFKAASNDPKTWQLNFSYEPINITAGAAGTAGNNITLQGILSFRERLISEKIIGLNLSTGKVTSLFDGYGVSRNQEGEYAYINTALKIVLTDGNGKQVAVFDPPMSASPENTIGGSGMMEAVISPSGKHVAIGGITRRVMETGGGISIPSLPIPSVSVLDRSGKEVAAFTNASYPTWTSGGKLMMTDPDEPGIFITDASLKNLKRIPNIPAGTILGMSMTADEKTIAFSLNNRIWLINTDGTGLKQLTQSGQSEVTPVWSPDGKYLAFQQNFPNKKEFYQIMVMSMSDGKVTPVTDEEGANREPLGRMSWVRK